MENLFLHKISRFRPFSFSSCHIKNVSDVVENSMIVFQNLHENAPPKNPKHTKDYIGFSPAFNKGRRRPPVTPISVVNSHLKWRAKQSKVSNSSSSTGGWFSSEEVKEGEVDDKSDTFFSLSSTSFRSFNSLKTGKTLSSRWDDKSTEMGRCFCDLSASSISTKPKEFKPKTDNATGKPPEQERETAKTHRKSSTTQRRSESDLQGEFDYYNDFSSSSHRKTSKPGQRKRRSRRRKGKTTLLSSEMGYAIEKSTNDPYNDFRTSMVEMIVEKQIFGAEDLQRLLQCFLSLNSSYFHDIIVEVFSEIIEALFSQ